MQSTLIHGRNRGSSWRTNLRQVGMFRPMRFLREIATASALSTNSNVIDTETCAIVYFHARPWCPVA